MKRLFYAGYNSYGTSFTYDSEGWAVHVFESKSARDAWVAADQYPNSNPTREAISAKVAGRIAPELKPNSQDIYNSFVVWH